MMCGFRAAPSEAGEPSRHVFVQVISDRAVGNLCGLEIYFPPSMTATEVVIFVQLPTKSNS